MTMPRRGPALAAVVWGSALLVGCSVTADPAGSSSAGSAVPPANVPPAPGRSIGSGTAPSYVDGVYAATGWYGGLPSSIDVTITLVGGTITDARVTPRATDPTSLDFQQRFAAAVPAVVVGRPIDQVEIDKLAGSSGTPVGFNEALSRIRAQAGG